jgi:hemerythrin-like domain-containing protein
VERFDLLHNIHKALRHAMLTFDLESGRIDYADRESVEQLRVSWVALRTNLAHHAGHEDEVIFPLLSARAPGEPRHPFAWEGEIEALLDDHRRIERFETDLESLLTAIGAEADPATRRLLGREFHRSVQRYTAMCLLHFDDEERHFMPRVWSLYGDDVLMSVFGRIMGMIGPEEREYVMGHMAEALDPVELLELADAAQAG